MPAVNPAPAATRRCPTWGMNPASSRSIIAETPERGDHLHAGVADVSSGHG